MATSRISPDADAVVSEIEIAAPVERVFEALIDPRQVMLWWTSEACGIEGFAMERRVGGRWLYDSKEGTVNVNGVTKFHCEGEVLEYDPPRRLAYTWIANWHEDKALRTVVRWELSQAGGRTRVKVTHSGLAKEQVARRDYSGGWPDVIDQLRKFVENESGEAQTAGTAGTASTASDADTIVSEIHIAAPAARVFQALVEPAQLVQWWGQKGLYQCTKFQNELRAGGKWKSEGVGPDGNRFEASGEYVEIDPPRLLVYTWVASWTGEFRTSVRWELEPTKEGTLVRIRHSGFAAHPELPQGYKGWPRMLGWLQALLERGETVNDR